MSKKWPGGIITPTTATPTGPYQDSTAPGIWTIPQADYWIKQGLWPTAGNIATVGLFGGGSLSSGTAQNLIQKIIIQTTGNATSFGALTSARYVFAGFSSSTRGVWAGGYPPNSSVMDYVTIATSGNATSFGLLSAATGNTAGMSNDTRGLIACGYTSTIQSAISYVTIATTGNSTSFGNNGVATFSAACCASTTRGVICGMQTVSGSFFTNLMYYVTIATTGNGTYFGDLIYAANSEGGGASSNTRGIIPNPSGSSIQYITIATTGNSVNFGNFTAPSSQKSNGASNSVRAVFSIGNNQTLGTYVNTLEYITIATTGNGTYFGDLTTLATRSAACSNSHGGL